MNYTCDIPIFAIIIVIITILVILQILIWNNKKCLIITGMGEISNEPVLIDVMAVDSVCVGGKKYETKRAEYVHWDSNSQIKKIRDTGDREQLQSLTRLLTKNVDFNKRKYFLHRIRGLHKDSEIYAEICKYFRFSDDTRADYHAEKLYQIYHTYIPKGVVRYLDIGCGDGKITRNFANKIGASDVHCVEIEDRVTDKMLKVSTKGLSIYPNGYFDIISAFMSLHHILDIEPMVREIYRVLRPGGVLVIKEHDCWNAQHAMLIDIEHAIYEWCISNRSLTEAKNECSYRNSNGWKKILHPLRFIAEDYYRTSPKYPITPTRAYWAVYKK